MKKLNVKLLISIIFIVLFLSKCTTILKGNDENGNPIFNSIQLEKKDYDGYEITSNYYTIANNIANPNSSVYISNKPSVEQIIDFATNSPSYFWLIHKEKEVIKIISLLQKSENWGDVKWSFLVQDIKNKTSKEFKINIWMLHITEHRMLEMKYGNKILDQKLMEADKRIFNKYIENKILGTVPYYMIYGKLLSLVNDGKLFLPETNVDNVEFKDALSEEPENQK